MESRVTGRYDGLGAVTTSTSGAITQAMLSQTFTNQMSQKTRTGKRIGLVGLSTPVFYDYGNVASESPADTISSPNPILEGAFGAMLLYDELWFLSRSLCPENMRGLECVKFLDENGMLPDVDPEQLPDPMLTFGANSLDALSLTEQKWSEARQAIGVTWDARLDNHTHGLIIDGSLSIFASPNNPKNVVYDLLLAERLGASVELITNRFTSQLLKTEGSARDRLVLTEELVLGSVPQFLSPSGPYHPCIDEVRESRYLKSFRQWIAEAGGLGRGHDIKSIKKEVEANLRNSMERVFLKYLDPASSFLSVAETIAGVGLDAMVPLSGAVLDLVGHARDECQKNPIRWQGFLVEARTKTGRH